MVRYSTLTALFRGLLVCLPFSVAAQTDQTVQTEAPQGEINKVEEHQQRARIQRLAERKAKKKKHPTLAVKGGSKQLRENIRNSLAFDRLSCGFTSIQRQHYQKKWLERVTQASRAMGYYHATWQWRTEERPSKQCWKAYLTVTPGKRTRFGNIDVSIVGAGNQLPAMKAILQTLPLKKGQPIDHQKYEQLKSLLLGTAQQLGFRDAAFDKKQLSVDLASYQADVLLVFNTGERYKFGAIHFDQDTLDDNFLRRYLLIKEGEPFDFKPLTELQQSLTDSRYFSLVDVQQLPPEDGSLHVPILIHLTPAKRRTTAVGLGYSSEPQPSPRVSLDFTNRRVNRFGHRFNANLQTAFRRQSLTTNYTIPLANPTIDQLRFTSLFEFEETNVLKSANRSFGVAWIKKLENQWQQTIDLTLLNETFEFTNSKALRERLNIDDPELLDTFSKRTSRFLLPGIGWQRTQSNDLFYPTRGWRASLNIKSAAAPLFADTNMTQLRVSAKQIYPLGDSRLHIRADFGTTWVEDFNVLPASLRFFAGGDNSVRGYAFESLGPVSDNPIDRLNAEISNGDLGSDDDPDANSSDTDSNGDIPSDDLSSVKPIVVGGKHLITASVEWDHPLWKDFSGALFVDAGNAFDNRQFRLKQSTGFGLRWRSPVGPIRMDFAFPIDDEDEDWRFHLALGTDL